MIQKIKNAIAIFDALSVALDKKDWHEIGVQEVFLRHALNDLLVFVGGENKK